MIDNGPNDRIFELTPRGSGAAEPAVYQIKRAGSGWDLSRRNMIAAVLAAFATGRAGKAQICGLAYAHGNAVTGMIPSLDGKSLITASLDATVKFWNLTTGAYYGTVILPTPITALAISSDSRLLTGSSSDNIIRITSGNGAPGGTLEGHTSPVRALATTPDGRILASAGEDTMIRLWSLPTGAYLRTLSGHTGTVRSLAISPDGEMLVSGSEDGTIRIWSLPDGHSMFRLVAHAGGVFSVAIDGRGRVMASGGADQMVKLWSMPDGSLLAALAGHAANVKAVAFNGQILISGSTDGTVRQWSVSSRSASGNTVSTGDSLTFLTVTPDGQSLFTSGTDSSGKASLKWWRASETTAGSSLTATPRLALLLCLIDLSVNLASVSGRQFVLNGIVYTLPCASPIPAGAKCRCDCVPGYLGYCRSETPCACDQECTCDEQCSCDPQCSCDQECSCNQQCTCDEQGCWCDPQGCGCDFEGCGCDGEGCGCDGEGCGCDGE
jgi:hypothetical protein